LLTREDQTAASHRFGFWAKGFKQWGDQDGDENLTGYDYDVYGLSLGFDAVLSELWLAGFSVGRSSTDVDYDNRAGDSDIESYFGSLYASYYNEALYLESVITYGRQEYDNRRHIDFGNICRTAYSEHDDDLYGAYLGGGYYFGGGPYRFGHFVSMQYTYLDEDGFTEKDAGGLNKRRIKPIYGKDTSKPTFHSRVCLVSDPKMPDAGVFSEVFKKPETLRAPIVGLPPALLRYARADVPCRRTKVRSNLVDYFLP
jgi:outer membrane autotransporter protein